MQFSVRIFFSSLGLFLGVGSANAELSLPDNMTGWVELRTAFSNTGREWLDGGLSKTRYGASEEDGFDAEISDFSLLWNPTWNANLSSHLHVQMGPDQDVEVGIVEGYLSYRVLPKAGWRLSARAGRFFPPISFEHDAEGWGLSRTLTPSAINSWVGEELAVTGAELSASKRIYDQRVELRASLFGYNDTAGALLGFRGWALHDVKSVYGGKFAIPEINEIGARFPDQADVTAPSEELDSEPGYYGSLRWRNANTTFSALYYDNRADPEILENGQYGWATEFISLGMHHFISDEIQLIGQVLKGSTAMGGIQQDRPIHAFQNNYASAFSLLSWEYEEDKALTARLEVFEVEDESGLNAYATEEGWAGTLALKQKISDNWEMGVEGVYVEHNRGQDLYEGLERSGLQLQTSLRLKF